MIGFISYATAALSAAASVSALVVPRGDKPPPPGWAHGYLEEYSVYHERYLTIRCHEHHFTTFFEDCCHPLLATETLEDDRLPYCTPSPEDIAAYAAKEATKSNPPSDDDDCEHEYNSFKSGGRKGRGRKGGRKGKGGNSSNGGGDNGDNNGDNNGDDNGDNNSGGGGGGGGGSSATNDSNGAQIGDQPPENPESVGDTSFVDGVFKGGFATFYFQEGLAGACRNFHSDDDFVVALDFRKYGNVNEVSEHCGKEIEVTNIDNGKTVRAIVTDACPTCLNENCVDLSPAAFEQIGDFDTGLLNVEWHFL